MKKKLFIASLLIILALVIYYHALANINHDAPVWRDPFSAPVKSMPTQTRVSKTNTARLVSIYYGKAQAIAAMIKQLPYFSNNTQIIVDARNNRLWLSTDKQTLNQITKFIHLIDTPAPQIEIAARIVTVDSHYLRQLGINFSSQTQHNISADGLHMTLPATASNTGQFRIALAKLGPNNTLDLELLALEEQGHAHMLSNPRLVTTNHHSAVIEAGEEIPYQETSLSGGTSTTFKKAVLSLNVTPVMLPNNKILLTLAVNQDKPSRTLVNGVPTVQTRQIKTQVMVNNDETIVLGGIYEITSRNAKQRVPFLGNIPLIGALFRTKVVEKQRHELLIFVTPSVKSAHT